MFDRERKEMITFLLGAILVFEAIVIWCLVMKVREVEQVQSKNLEDIRKNSSSIERLRKMCYDLMERIK